MKSAETVKPKLDWWCVRHGELLLSDMTPDVIAKARDMLKETPKLAARRAVPTHTGRRTRAAWAGQWQETRPQDKDQINLTDEESRIMKSGGGFEQYYNAQAAVDTGSMLIVGGYVTQACNGKQQITPMLALLATHPDAVGAPENC